MVSRLAKLALAGLAGLTIAGCGNNQENHVRVNSVTGDKLHNISGNVNFMYKWRVFFDDGFDGTLDRVIDYNKKGERFDKDSPGFENYIPLYLEARKKATEMK